MVAVKVTWLHPYRVPAAPARAAEVTKAIILYLVTLMPTLSAAMRLSRAAMMARPVRLIDQIENNDQGDHHQDKTSNKGGNPGGVHHAHGTLNELDAALAQGVLIAEEAELEAVLIHTQIDVGQQALDDLAEGQGNNSQIVAVEAQHGDTDKEAEENRPGRRPPAWPRPGAGE